MTRITLLNARCFYYNYGDEGSPHHSSLHGLGSFGRAGARKGRWEIMKKKFMIYLFAVIAVCCISISATVGMYARREIEQILEHNKKEYVHLAERHLNFFDKSLESMEHSVAAHRKESILKVTAGLVKDGKVNRNITSAELRALANRCGVSEIYVIDNTGRIFMTTFEPDVYFNLFAIDEKFARMLKSLFGADRVFLQRASISNMTGKVNWYSYYSPPGGDFLIETSIGLKDYIVREYSSEYYDMFFKYFPVNDEHDSFLVSFDLYRRTNFRGWSLLHEGKRFEKEKEFVDRIRREGEVSVRRGDRITVYSRITLKNPAYDYNDSFIAEAVYDFGVVTRFARMTFIFSTSVSILIIVIVFAASSGIFNALFVNRVFGIISGLKSVEQGNYDIAMNAAGNDEFSRIAANITRMSEAIKEREEKLKHSAENLIRANRHLERKIGDLGIAREQLERANMESEFYMDLMSHDLTNFNHAVLGNLALLERVTPPDEKTKKYIDSCKRQIVKSEGLISKVRAFAQIKSIAPEKLRPIDLNQCVADAVHIVENLYGPERARISFTPEGRRTVIGTELLDSAVLNVIENAVKHGAGNGGEVAVTISERNEETLELRVVDSGPGVPDEMKEKIFDRYARIGVEKGMGLGLSLAKAIVEKLGGRIRVEDIIADGETAGSAFIITLHSAEA